MDIERLARILYLWDVDLTPANMKAERNISWEDTGESCKEMYRTHARWMLAKTEPVS